MINFLRFQLIQKPCLIAVCVAARGASLLFFWFSGFFICVLRHLFKSQYLEGLVGLIDELRMKTLAKRLMFTRHMLDFPNYKDLVAQLLSEYGKNVYALIVAHDVSRFFCDYKTSYSSSLLLTKILRHEAQTWERFFEDLIALGRGSEIPSHVETLNHEGLVFDTSRIRHTLFACDLESYPRRRALYEVWHRSRYPVKYRKKYNPWEVLSCSSSFGSVQPIQYWSQGKPPAYLQVISNKWNGIFNRLSIPQIRLFDKLSARNWIITHTPEFLTAFDTAPHYAFESDVFRLAFSSICDTFWLDSDMAPGRHAHEALREILRSNSSMMFVGEPIPEINNCIFISRKFDIIFAHIYEKLSHFSYVGIDKSQINNTWTPGPFAFRSAFIERCNKYSVNLRISDLVEDLGYLNFDKLDYQIVLAGSSLAVCAGGLAYKKTDDHWVRWTARNK